MKGLLIIMLTACMLLGGIGCNSSQEDDYILVEQTYHVETFADSLLKEMGDYLKSADAFTLRAESSYDAVDQDGQSIRYGGISEVAVRRPDGLQAVFIGDERETKTYFDGKTVTIYGAVINMYTVTEVPGDIDSAVDAMFDKYGVSIPLADFVYADPYGILIENVIDARWVGRHTISGVPCNHLAFIQDSVDWQIWIEDGDQPVPRQILITYKNEPGFPQYLARLTNWNFKPQLSDNDFKFQPPAGSDEMEFIDDLEMEADNE